MNYRYLVASIAISVVCAATAVQATPLTLDYTVTAQGGGNFNYNFSLVLDNHDGSWSSGQNFNWIVFGDVAGVPQAGNQIYAATNLTNFTGNSANLPIGPFTYYTTTNGGHNGPTLFDYNNGNPDAGGWVPTIVGNTLTWSGTSSADLQQGQLLWSNIMGSGVQANFEVANLVSAVPLPGTSALFGSALLGIGAMAARRRNPGGAINRVKVTGDPGGSAPVDFRL
jgi:hypothetical protein